MENLYIASDHAGYKAKEEIKKILEKNKIEYEDLGPFNEISVDYPDYAKKVADKVTGKNAKGILICGSGIGMQIAANKINGIRAAFAPDEYSAKMSRLDNDANILTLRGREFDTSKYEPIINTFLNTKFSNEKRHLRRIDKIKQLEYNN